MSFTIRIDRNETVVKKCGKEWKVVGSDANQNNPKYGYTPEIEKEQEVVTKVFEQTVAELDLNAVIKAVNKL